MARVKVSGRGKSRGKAGSASKGRLEDLLQVYHDLEKTLRELKAVTGAPSGLGSALKHIDVTGLIRQLSESKRRLELKIRNVIALEKAHIRRKIEGIFKSPSRDNG